MSLRCDLILKISQQANNRSQGEILVNKVLSAKALRPELNAQN